MDPPKIYVAAIDNGLAFPFKHPDSWRACKYIDLKNCFSMISFLYKKFLDYKDRKVHVHEPQGPARAQHWHTRMFALLCSF